MLILSKFHDYYDSVAKVAGIDKNLVYKRVNSKEGISTVLPLVTYYYTPFPSAYAFLVGFCGNTYRGVKVRENKTNTFFYGEEAVQELQRIASLKEDVIDYIRRTQVTSSWNAQRQIRNYSNEIFNKWLQFEFTVDPYRKYNTPSIILEAEDLYESIRTVNPCLKDYAFQKVVDPYTTYQEIQMFLSGVLGISDRPTVEISDKNRLESHGFDKWSFRQPENRKKRKNK